LTGAALPTVFKVFYVFNSFTFDAAGPFIAIFDADGSDFSELLLERAACSKGAASGFFNPKPPYTVLFYMLANF